MVTGTGTTGTVCTTVITETEELSTVVLLLLVAIDEAVV